MSELSRRGRSLGPLTPGLSARRGRLPAPPGEARGRAWSDCGCWSSRGEVRRAGARLAELPPARRTARRLPPAPATPPATLPDLQCGPATHRRPAAPSALPELPGLSAEAAPPPRRLRRPPPGTSGTNKRRSRGAWIFLSWNRIFLGWFPTRVHGLTMASLKFSAHFFRTFLPDLARGPAPGNPSPCPATPTRPRPLLCTAFPTWRLLSGSFFHLHFQQFHTYPRPWAKAFCHPATLRLLRPSDQAFPSSSHSLFFLHTLGPTYLQRSTYRYLCQASGHHLQRAGRASGKCELGVASRPLPPTPAPPLRSPQPRAADALPRCRRESPARR